MFNLTTGAFTRTGIASNQLAIYGLDTAMIATLRGASEVAGRQHR